MSNITIENPDNFPGVYIFRFSGLSNSHEYVVDYDEMIICSNEELIIQKRSFKHNNIQRYKCKQYKMTCNFVRKARGH